MLAPDHDWAQKMLCIAIHYRLPYSIGEQHLLSSFRAFVHDGYCLAILVRVRQTFIFYLTKKEGTTDDSGKRFGYYQQDYSNLDRENSVSDRSQGL